MTMTKRLGLQRVTVCIPELSLMDKAPDSATAFPVAL